MATYVSRFEGILDAARGSIRVRSVNYLPDTGSYLNIVQGITISQGVVFSGGAG